MEWTWRTIVLTGLVAWRGQALAGLQDGNGRRIFSCELASLLLVG